MQHAYEKYPSSCKYFRLQITKTKQNWENCPHSLFLSDKSKMEKEQRLDRHIKNLETNRFVSESTLDFFLGTIVKKSAIIINRFFYFALAFKFRFIVKKKKHEIVNLQINLRERGRGSQDWFGFFTCQKRSRFWQASRRHLRRDYRLQACSQCYRRRSYWSPR